MSRLRLLRFLFFIVLILAGHSKCDKIIQSELCTGEEMDAGTQCFKAIPEKEYFIPRGYTVVFPCEISNQHGKAQWRAKDVLLGYDRELPGNQRFKMLGDPERGQHTLEITNLQPSDAGEYECQVTPVPSKNHPLLRRKTFLEVIVMPSLPQLSQHGFPLANNKLIISIPDQHPEVTVDCIARDGIPPPDFFWYLNGQLLNGASNISESEADRNLIAKIAPRITHSHERSTLTMSTSGLVDEDRLKCEVSNRATLFREDPRGRKLKTTAKVNLQVPPGPPIITETNAQTKTFEEHKPLTATCVSRPPGNPVGGLFWRWNFPSMNFTGRSRRPAFHPLQPPFWKRPDLVFYEEEDYISEDVSPSFYTTRQTNNELITQLTIPSISRRHHGANLTCETGHGVGEVQRTSLYVMISYAPHNLTIVSPGTVFQEEFVQGRLEQVAYGREGSSMTFTCTTSAYYPDVTLRWTLDTDDHTISYPITPSQKDVSRKTSDDISFQKTSTVNIDMLSRNQLGFLRCQALFGEQVRIDKRVRLGIIYPPETPIVSGFPVNNPMRQGHIHELMCTCKKGNPAPKLVWLKNDKPITSVFTRQETLEGVSLKIEIVAKMEDNGAKMSCMATNAAVPKGLNSTSLDLQIYFPPDNINIKFLGPSSVTEGSDLQIDCVTGISNPKALIRWRYYHCSPVKLYARNAYLTEPTFVLDGDLNIDMLSMLYTEAQFERGKRCQMEELTGIDDPDENSTFRGFISHGHLVIRPRWVDHADFVECVAENVAFGPTSVQKRVKLDVPFAPQFIGFETGSQHSIVEGSSGTLDLIPYANPSVSSIDWYSGVPGKKLTPTPLDLNDDRKSSLFKRKAAKISGVFSGGPMGKLLTLWQVTRNHMRNYTVEANNSVGSTRKVFFLNVTYASSITETRSANVSLNGVANLVCFANSNPAIASHAFSWHRFITPEWNDDGPSVATTTISCGNSTKLNGEIKHFVNCEDIDQFNMKSTLIVYNVAHSDVGNYVCIVDNGVGQKAKSTMALYSTFPPTIVKRPKYAKAATKFGNELTLVCFIRAEPQPVVFWFVRKRHDTRSLVFDDKCDDFVEQIGAPCQTKVAKVTVKKQKKRFKSSLSRIQPGQFNATFSIADIQVSDFANYTCKVSSANGVDSFMVEASGTGPPDTPFNLSCVEATTNTLHISWIQGFNGGYQQTFRVRWKSDHQNSEYMYQDVKENENANSINFYISGLKANEKYIVSVNSRNEVHGIAPYTPSIFVNTSSADGDSDLTGGYHSLKPISSTKSNSLFIIVTACVIGGIVIFINILVISFLMRKKQKQRIHFGGGPVLCRTSGERGGSDPRIMPIGLNNRPLTSHKSYSHIQKPGDELFSPRLQSSAGHFYSPDPLLTAGAVKSGQFTPSCSRNYGYLTTPNQGNYSGYSSRTPGPYQQSNPSNSRPNPICLSSPYQNAFQVDGSANIIYPVDQQLYASMPMHLSPNMNDSHTTVNPQMHQPQSYWYNTVTNHVQEQPIRSQCVVAPQDAVMRSHSSSELLESTFIGASTSHDSRTLSRSIGARGQRSKSGVFRKHKIFNEEFAVDNLPTPPVEDRRRVSFSDLTQPAEYMNNSYIGYAEESYIDQLQALQRGKSPTKKLLLPDQDNNRLHVEQHSSDDWFVSPEEQSGNASSSSDCVV